MEQRDQAESLAKDRRGNRVFSLSCTGLILILSYMILAPVFRSAKQQSQIIICMDNIRQLGRALLQYGDDNNERFPPSGKWAGGIARYLHGSGSARRAIFHCPAAPQTVYGYALNDKIGERFEKSLASPYTLVMLFEANFTTINGHGSERDVIWGRHPNGVNVGCADGHVRHIMGTPEHPNLDHVTLEWSP